MWEEWCWNPFLEYIIENLTSVSVEPGANAAYWLWAKSSAKQSSGLSVDPQIWVILYGGEH